MPLASERDTIAAVATPTGEGGISIIRVSGEKAFEIIDKVFKGKQLLAQAPPYTVHVGSLLSDRQQKIDNVLATVFKAPKSYTGEDVVEISCHGGIYITNKALETVLHAGARLASPGEFTRRAFLNGKIDLAQAEAVADLIKSKSDIAQRASLQQLEGRLSKEILDIRAQIIETAGLLELELDFSEEGYEFIDREKIVGLIGASLEKIHLLATSYHKGVLFREGARIVLAGAPNVGKSSLLNALLKKDRAIVTEIAGTTRDVIEESIYLDDILAVVSDTAGIRDTDEPVEREGVKRARKQVEDSHLMIIIIDSSNPHPDSEHKTYEKMIQQKLDGGNKAVTVFNKIDLVSTKRLNEVKTDYFFNGCPSVDVSALEGIGMDELRKTMRREILFGAFGGDEGSAMITNTRHYEALNKAEVYLKDSLESVENKLSGEFITVDLRGASEAIGEIVGITTSEDILDYIFSKFCIGK
ncbi:MAG: tRNA uridine-5-carboxymethylaminomethyl(34) synthesis GTPase MnmE [bacterium]